MASGPSVDVAKAILDGFIGGIAYTAWPVSVDVRLWTAAPGFDGTGGTEVTGGAYTPAVLTVSTAVDGGPGQIAKVLSSAALTWFDLTVASTGVVASSVHDHVTGDMIWLNDSWTSPSAWSVGDSPSVPAAAFFVDLVPVS